VLYTLVGSFGIPVVVRDSREFCVQRHIGILRPSDLLDVSFLALALESKSIFDQAAACATGIAQKTVPLSGLRAIEILLPPIEEQRRIVSRVNELLTLCGSLTKSITNAENARTGLLEVMLSQALQVTNAATNLQIADVANPQFPNVA
jgi:type I restriction enzyme S subunit